MECQGVMGLTSTHETCTCCLSGLTYVCVCVWEVEATPDICSWCFVSLCVCVADNQITEAGAKELAKALKTNCALQTLNLGGKCREDASIGTARGTERGMVCVSGCGGG